MRTSRTRLPRDHWLRRIHQLDPAADHEQIYAITSRHEFPWDMSQALSFALFRTYAVPSIGVLLEQTGEFTERTQRRYDDTALLLDHIGEHGIGSAEGKQAVRRINQMHAMYPIGNDDLRYVLCTFVAVPIRWLDDHGWRPLTEHEKVASAHYYRALGRHLGIKDIPETWQDFTTAMDAYEVEHFGFDRRSRRVADATLALMATFPPNDRAPARAVVRFSRAYMDTALLDAFHYPRPTRLERWLADAALRVRNAWLRSQPPRLAPQHVRDGGNVRSHPDGYEVAALGTFSRSGTISGCPRPPRA